MAVTDTDATERVESEPAVLDPSISPVHHETRHSPVPKVAHHAHAAATIDRAERAEVRPRGVKLAKISRTGDRVFRSLATTSGLLIVLLVLFVGIFLLALALPSLQADQDNFLTSRNWTVAGNELRFGIAGLFWTTVLSSILAMVLAVPVAVGVALCLTMYLHSLARFPLWWTCLLPCRQLSLASGD
jgi:phosphate transport system permease protein